MIKFDIDSENRPNRLLSMHAEQLVSMAEHYRLNANKQVQLDNTIQRLTDAMGKCERIKNTVFPRAYGVLIHFLIYVLTTIFPFGLDDIIGRSKFVWLRWFRFFLLLLNEPRY